MSKVADVSLPQYPDTLIKSILRSVKTIAMVGASANDIRPSYFAMMYLLNKGYKVNQSRRDGQEILGQTVYASLKDVPAPVDMVDIFREAKFAPDIARETVAEKDRLGVKVLWMQLGVISPEAEQIGKDAGLTAVMNRCPKIEHGRFSRRDRLDGRQPQGDRQPKAAAVWPRRHAQARIGSCRACGLRSCWPPAVSFRPRAAPAMP